MISKVDQIYLELITEIDLVKNQLIAYSEVKLKINDSIPYFDGEEFDFDLLRSCYLNNGNYFLFTCSCGVPQCVGRYKGINIKHNERFISWTDLDCDKSWVFDVATLKTQIESINKKECDLAVQFSKRGIIYKKRNETDGK